MNIVKEDFESIDKMLSVVTNRPNNDIMKSENSSNTSSYSFTGTHNWNEAVNLFRKGYTEVLGQIKKGVSEDIKRTESIQKRRTSTNVVGYAPHVPNAILGLPNSMIFTESVPQKVKAISIVYSITETCGHDKDEFVTSGICVLNIINRLELLGYRVSLKIMFMCAKEGNDRAFGSIKVKDFKEHLDLQKLCFPVAHSSMFRRFGFKWLETCRGLRDREWPYGYGTQCSEYDSGLQEYLQENEFYISLKKTERFNYDAQEIIKEMNIN